MSYHKSQAYFKEKINGYYIAMMLAIIESTLRDHVDPNERKGNPSGSPDMEFQSM